MARINTSPLTRGTRTSSEEEIPIQVKQRIAEVAYRLYEERGREPGHELEDWLEAERRVLGNRR